DLLAPTPVPIILLHLPRGLLLCAVQRLACLAQGSTLLPTLRLQLLHTGAQGPHLLAELLGMLPDAGGTRIWGGGRWGRLPVLRRGWLGELGNGVLNGVAPDHQGLDLIGINLSRRLLLHLDELVLVLPECGQSGSQSIPLMVVLVAQLPSQG